MFRTQSRRGSGVVCLVPVQFAAPQSQSAQWIGKGTEQSHKQEGNSTITRLPTIATAERRPSTNADTLQGITAGSSLCSLGACRCPHHHHAALANETTVRKLQRRRPSTSESRRGSSFGLVLSTTQRRPSTSTVTGDPRRTSSTAGNGPRGEIWPQSSSLSSTMALERLALATGNKAGLTQCGPNFSALPQITNRSTKLHEQSRHGQSYHTRRQLGPTHYAGPGGLEQSNQRQGTAHKLSQSNRATPLSDDGKGVRVEDVCIDSRGESASVDDIISKATTPSSLTERPTDLALKLKRYSNSSSITPSKGGDKVPHPPSQRRPSTTGCTIISSSISARPRQQQHKRLQQQQPQRRGSTANGHYEPSSSAAVYRLDRRRSSTPTVIRDPMTGQMMVMIASTAPMVDRSSVRPTKSHFVAPKPHRATRHERQEWALDAKPWSFNVQVPQPQECRCTDGKGGTTTTRMGSRVDQWQRARHIVSSVIHDGSNAENVKAVKHNHFCGRRHTDVELFEGVSFEALQKMVPQGGAED